MVDKEMLEAMSKLIDEKMAMIGDNIDKKLVDQDQRLDDKIDKKLANQEERILDGVKILLENGVQKQINLIAEDVKAI